MKNTIFAFSTRIAVAIGTVTLLVLVLAPSELNAHGGGLNKCGCHFDRRTNPPTCHCHQSPYGGCGSECYSSHTPSGRLASGCAVVNTELLAKALADPVLTQIPVPRELQAGNDEGGLKSAIWVWLVAHVRAVPFGANVGERAIYTLRQPRPAGRHRLAQGGERAGVQSAAANSQALG